MTSKKQNMQGEIITIGNELISGRTLDLNSWYAAGRLTTSGLKVTRVTTVGDEAEAIAAALKDAVGSSDFVIITGGLGSTDDDLTNKIAAEALDRPLCLDRDMLEQIRVYMKNRGMDMNASLEKMAWMPKNSKLLDPQANVCGFSLVEDHVRLYFLPGVPEQMRFLMDTCVLPDLLLHCKSVPLLRYQVLKLYGLTEPMIAEALKDLSSIAGNIILGYYPRFPENHITLSLRGDDEPAMLQELDLMEKEIRTRVGAYIFAAGEQTMEGVVGTVLREKQLTLSLAESCTGGLIGNLISNVPGSSEYFVGGVIAYSNQVKMDLLGVSRRTLDQHGAVSEQTVTEMAAGAQKKFKTDLSLAVSGIAGPEGGSPDKPVGTVCIGMVHRSFSFSKRYRFWGARDHVKLNSAMMALDWVRRHLRGDSFLSGF
ncbi:MAG: CinA family nicotinamide mononucleotide deamidase-related protein [Deltaproteobacteria bacterium]|nr:CinA family nicotinamide mononucleotide deamidase-related protein [Deltaproteobacteria bacterium]